MSHEEEKSQKRPRKKPPALDRTTKEGKQRAAELKRQASEGMSGWLSQGKQNEKQPGRQQVDLTNVATPKPPRVDLTESPRERQAPKPPNLIGAHIAAKKKDTKNWSW